MKNVYKTMIIAGAIAVIGSGVYFGTDFVLNEKKISNTIPVSIEAPVNDEDKEKLVSIEKFGFYRINEKGEVIQENVEFKGEPSIQVLVEYILSIYSDYSENEVVNIPKNTKVLSIEIKTGTLFINLSKEVMDSKMFDRTVEEKFLETIGNTIYPFAKNMGFRDFQILVEGKSESSIFGSAPTGTPRIIIPW